ncbi:MAG TPA: low temperature requirement protein A, partial [Candidatus Limnocylindrales bacterium]|nr:low temperature requirement protein A [Candidatus Limnocylindrales bacterium]
MRQLIFTTGGRGMKAAGPQSVTFVELFFDLVFVFAVTQVTALTAHDLTVPGILRSLLLFWLIWWAWTQFTWTLNPADTTHSSVRLITLAATAAAFVMAAAVPHAVEADALWFAVPSVTVRMLGLALQGLVDLENEASGHRGVWLWASMSLVGLALVLAGAVAPPEIRVWLWTLTIVADLVAAGVAGRAQDWQLDSAHMSERHGLFVIIALGESLIVAGTAVAADVRTAPLVAAAAMALLVACLLWW